MTSRNKKVLKTRHLNRNAPKAKVHKPKKGKGSFTRAKNFLKALFSGIGNPMWWR